MMRFNLQGMIGETLKYMRGQTLKQLRKKAQLSEKMCHF